MTKKQRQEINIMISTRLFHLLTEMALELHRDTAPIMHHIKTKVDGTIVVDMEKIKKRRPPRTAGDKDD